MTKADKTMILLIMNNMNKDLVRLWKNGFLGEDAINAAISHEILMILQTRQNHPMSTTLVGAIACEFDIVKVRIGVFEKLKQQ